MPFQADLVYRDRETIIDELIAALQARIPNAVLTEDTVWRILFEVFATPVEGLFQAVQLLHNDMFPQTAEAVSLVRYGEQYGVPEKGGTRAVGTVVFAGAGGTYIPLGTEVASPQPGDDALYFNTTVSGTLPNPGTPTAPTVADAAVSGTLTGTFEWAVTFVTAMGETEVGASSSSLVLSASQANLTAIAVGGPGTTKRRIYRMQNGGLWGFVHEVADNTATTWTDNVAVAGGAPPSESTANQITMVAEAIESGTQYNVLTGTITEITDGVAGLTSVTNPGAFTGGSDPEATESYRTRLLEFIRNPKTGSPQDLEMWAEQVEGVSQATAIPNDNLGTPTNGHVTVRISGPDGTIPGAPVIAAVLAYLVSKDIANITIHVGTFTANTVTPTVDVTTETGFVLADVTSSVQAAVAAYINSRPVGGTVYKAGIAAAAFGLPGVANVAVTLPAADVTSTATQKPVSGVVTVT